MPEKFEAYLKTVAAQIRWKRAQPVLLEELRTHLLDQRDDCITLGMDEDSAQAEALRQLGDPVSVGQELDRVHRPKAQWGLLTLTILLALVGAALRALLPVDAGRRELLRTLSFLLVGFAALVGGYGLDYSTLCRHSRLIYWTTVALSAVAALSMPVWYGLHRLTGIMALLYPLVYALRLSALRRSGWGGLVTAMLLAVPPILLALMTPSVLGMFLILMVSIVLLLSMIWRGEFGVHRGLATGLLVAAALVPVAVFGLTRGEGLQMRLQAALNPATEANGMGYQGVMALRALTGAKLWGTGEFTNLHGEAAYWVSMPSADTDFLLTSLIHSLGWIPFLLLCALLLALLVWAMIKCLRQKQAAGRLVAVSIVLTIGLRLAISVAMNLGFVLLCAGCPFVTGNAQSVVDLALMGVLLSVFRQEALPMRQPTKHSRRRLRIHIEFT